MLSAMVAAHAAAGANGVTQLPEQISLELHYGTSMQELPWFGRFKSAGEVALWMDQLWRVGRYLLVDRRDGICPHCTELLLMTEGALRRMRAQLRTE